MLLTETNIIFRGIRPIQKLSETAREMALKATLATMSINQRTPENLRVVPPDPWPGDAQRGRDLLAGIFRFAGQTIAKENLSWKPLDAKPEWVAELHGFEWLRDLRSVGGDRARRMAREMVSSWLDIYQKPESTAWAPAVTGVRLASWISFHDFFCASADDAFRRQYFSSLARQARYLAKALPGNLSGIRLVRALRGLAYSGIAFEDEEGRLDLAFKLILDQIGEQILPDGGHVSRSPQATFDFLQCLVDLRAAGIAARLELPEQIQHAIDRITPAVKFYRHADGSLAHFNGGQQGNAHLVETTLMHSGARGKASKSLPHSGYERLCMGRASVIMDTGLPLVSKYSDRAHAGLLSFEYAYGRDRVIVNCGSSEVKGKWREILRSTAAHSTLVADHRNSCPFDEMGFLSARPEVRVKRTEDGDVVLLDTAHNGYIPRFGLTHRRTLRLQEGGDALIGEDSVSGKSGVLFAIRFHLHPDIQASLIQEGDEVLLRAKSGIGWRFKASGYKVVLEESIYGGEGEHPRRTQQIALHVITAGMAVAVAWELRREKL